MAGSGPRSGVWPISDGALRIALYTGLPLAAGYYLIHRSRKGDPYRTDFDGFLKAMEEPGSTGLTHSASKDSGKGQGLTSGSIDKFFRDAGEDEDTRNPLDFDSFLRGAAKASSGTSVTDHAKKATPEAPKEQAKAHHIRVALLYGTEYGFSKEVTEILATQLKATDTYWPVVLDMAEHGEGYELSKEQVVFMACSTQGDGVPPTEARDFCEWVFAGKAGKLSSTFYSVCALGDRSYQHFCRCGKQLDAALAASGAQELAPRADINKEDYPAVDAWVQICIKSLDAKKADLQPIGEAAAGAAAAAAGGKAAHTKKWGKSRPYFANVVAQEGLCTINSKDDKNTIRSEFDLGSSGITYLPGDALGIYPTNAPEAADALIAQLGASASQCVPVPSWHYQEEGEVYADGTMPLKDALIKCYDLRVPKADILKMLLSLLEPTNRLSNGHANGHTANGAVHAQPGNSSSSTDEQKVKLSQLLAADGTTTDKYFAERHVIDVLEEFASAHPTVQQLLTVLRQLQPRLYSISSSPLEKPQHVQVTVAEVKYETLGRDRVGVCSTYLSERLPVGSRVPIYVHKNPDFRLPADPATPILMVGPGTGLAPFRSFILDRLLARKQAGAAPQEGGEMVLYFGCRRSDQDYLYGPVLEGWSEAGDIKLFTAFSRQQAKKVYVQDRLRESADLVWSLLQRGAHFYVCGDASSMAGAVETQLLTLIQENQGQGSEAAKEYLQALSDSGRYQRDVWY